MRFIMYVDGKQIDSIELLPSKVNISELMAELKNKHKNLLNGMGTEPVFAIEHVPSSINSFRPLEADKSNR